LLSEPDDIESLSDNLGRMIRDPNLRHRMGPEGRKRVETVLTPRRMAEESLTVYRQISNAASRSSSAATS
jgi:glycosyltransferase involved in cell wall biosynthesis